MVFQVIDRLPNLKLLLTTGGRNASIDVKACEARSVPVAGTTGGGPPAGPDSTTQHCVALLCKHILASFASVSEDL